MYEYSPKFHEEVRMKLYENAGSSLVMVATLILMVVLSAVPLTAQDATIALEDPEGDKLFEQDPGFPECMGPDDPFCPSGGGGGSGYDTDEPFCMKCERTCDSTGVCGPTCEQVDYEEPGRTDCTERYDGARPVYCEAFGNFCEKIRVGG
jgi:hypothetical protein